MEDQTRRLNVLLWDSHGPWTSSFARGRHHYLVPEPVDDGPWVRDEHRHDRLGATVVAPSRLRDTEIDVVVLQHPDQFTLAMRWLGRQPGRDIPAVYVEHDPPSEHAATTLHPLAEHTDIPLVHITEFNRLMWDNGACRTSVIPHGIADPGARYTGELPRAAAVINEPVRRWRVTGTDLLPAIGAAAPVDVYGIRAAELRDPYAHVHGVGKLPQQELHDQLTRRRVYVHTARWTSLGPSLIEAMHLGMPVVAVASTEAVRAVPPEAGVLSANVDELAAAVRSFVCDPDLAQITGKSAREFALNNYGLRPFLDAWDEQLWEVTR